MLHSRRCGQGAVRLPCSFLGEIVAARNNWGARRALRRRGYSVGGEREIRLTLGIVGGRLRRRVAVSATRPAALRAIAKRIFNDRLHAAQAAAAFDAAAKAIVHMFGVTERIFSRRDGGANVFIAQHVAGTDNHGGRGSPVDDVLFDMKALRRMQKEKPLFEGIPN
jgi:hypothetical protein